VADGPQQIKWLANSGQWQGEFIGSTHGSGVCIVFANWPDPGGGPALHRHPYSETFIVREGFVLFEIDGAELTARTGEIVVAPLGAAHKFSNAGPGPIDMIGIHASIRVITEWL
jgi:mannose-6-phosphate isomerase-like protein (cupin superfamily)